MRKKRLFENSVTQFKITDPLSLQKIRLHGICGHTVLYGLFRINT